MKFLFSIFLTLIFSASFCQYKFVINGITDNFLNNHKIYLIVVDSYSENRYKKEDSAFVKNNRFYFSGQINKPSEKAELYTKDIRGFFYFVVDSGNNDVRVKTLQPKTPFYKNKLSNSQVLNSQSNNLRKTIDSLINYYFLKKGRPSAENKNIIELSARDKTELRDKELSLIKQYPNSYYSLIHLYYMSSLYLSLNSEDIENTYKALSKETRSSQLGLEFYEKIQLRKGSEIGSKVKIFTATTNKDSIFSNSFLTDKPYLIAFGATWCKPCKERLPLLKLIYSKYHQKGFEVVYINLDEKTEKWKKQIIQDKMEWINISENVKWADSKISKFFNVKALPFYLLIDRTGKIIYNELQLKDDNLKQLEKYITETLK